MTEDVMDYIKAGVAVAPPTMTLFGVSLQDWMYIVSITAALMLILEKFPSVFKTIKGFLLKKEKGSCKD